MAMKEVTVTDIVYETPSIVSIYLALPDGTPIGHYVPGAHIDVEGPTAITRQYSLCGRPDGDDAYVVAVKREEASRGGSEALHTLKVGDTLKISEPRNLIGIEEEASHHILIAGGIGITPMHSMARYMDVRGISFELHYFASSEEEAAFLPILREKCPEKLHTHLGISREEQTAVLQEVVKNAPEGSHAYLCGPEGFMEKVTTILSTRFTDEEIHFENFHAAEIDESGNTAFVVELEGEEYDIPADRSIVEVLNENGAEIDTSCEEGICGTCIMSVLQGTPEHRDNVLTKGEREANETMAVCVSRTRDPKLVLDYF
ncbi:PDR/VanB family oxidoreductase [Corynebacterium sp. YIM 101645]|uniref:PDR/VanB family oxidoreductase n=1 Tax=Corynebacterium lemuris TaxID=1859292 RepID=A0ABT2G3Q0_9CORY|nr:PDR/VanB family oxidoreductase [Corynebacterium lemuris]MCS5480907.1 PDR/VanB family oxidoreductase [Corynebacterium lemuris]